jgi:hypothetical protein
MGREPGQLREAEEFSAQNAGCDVAIDYNAYTITFAGFR